MKKSFVPQAPRPDDFTFIYNDQETHVSKYHFALYSSKFRKIPEFYVTNSLAIQDDPPFDVFCQFLRAAQGIEINIKVDNAIDILHFCEVWEVESVASDVKKLISSTTELNRAVQKILSAKKKGSNYNLEDLIANNIDTALQIQSLTDFPIQTLTRIINSPTCIIKKPHRYYRFVKQMLNKIGPEASILASRIDFTKLSSEEAIDFLRHPKLIKSFIADSLTEATILLLQDNNKFSNQLTEYRNQLNQMIQRVKALEQSTAFDYSDNPDSVKQINKKISQLESKINSKVIDNSNFSDPNDIVSKALSKIDKIVNDTVNSISKSYSEIEQKAHKNLRKTNKIVNNLTKKSSNLESDVLSLKSDNTELKNSMTTILRKVLENEDAVGRMKSLSSSSSSSSLKQIVAQFNGQPYNGIFTKLKENSNGDPYLKKKISITASTSDRNEAFQVIDYGWNDFFFTENKPNSWILFDFKDMRIHITNYTLKTHKYPSGTCHIKSWIIEGSNGKNIWSEIDKRSSPVLNGPNRFQTFPATKSNDTFQYIRLRQTGFNFRNDNILAIASIEFFGTIYLS